jgi:hypothetical protein
MAPPSCTARHTRRNTPVDSFGTAPGLPFASSSLTGIIRPRRLPLLHRHRHRRPRLLLASTTVTVALASTTVPAASQPAASHSTPSPSPAAPLSPPPYLP